MTVFVEAPLPFVKLVGAVLETVGASTKPRCGSPAGSLVGKAATASSVAPTTGRLASGSGPERGQDEADGIAAPDADGIAALACSIAAHGQTVPILVRPRPQAPGRYQIAYGRRRHAACARLGRPVRAVVREMDAAALVVAQGQENCERRDLTFVERALFAHALDAASFDRAMSRAALGLHNSELTRTPALVAAYRAGRW